MKPSKTRTNGKHKACINTQYKQRKTTINTLDKQTKHKEINNNERNNNIKEENKNEIQKETTTTTNT